MTEQITPGELVEAGFVAGNAWLGKASIWGLSTPWSVAAVSGLSLLHAFFNNPKPTVAIDDGQQSPSAAKTYPDEPPPAQWAIGPTLVGGAIVYANVDDRIGGDTVVGSEGDKKSRKNLHLAVALTEGGMEVPDALYVWVNGQRTRYERQIATADHKNPDGTTTDWYEPVPSGARLFFESWEKPYLDSNEDWTKPVGGSNRKVRVGDILITVEREPREPKGTASFARAKAVDDSFAVTDEEEIGTIEGVAVKSNKKPKFYRSTGPLDETVDIGALRFAEDGRVFKVTANDFVPAGLLPNVLKDRIFLKEAEVLNIADDADPHWHLFASSLWQGRSYLYPHFAADGTGGQELKVRSEVKNNLEWQPEHKLMDISWVHIAFGSRMDARMSRQLKYRVGPENFRKQVSRPPSLSFEVGGIELPTARGKDSSPPVEKRTDHPATVAYWYLSKRLGVPPELLRDFETAEEMSQAAATADQVASVDKYRFVGVITSDQSPLALLEVLEFILAGSFVWRQGAIHLRPLQIAPYRGMLEEDDILSIDQYETQQSARLANTVRMQLAVCPESGNPSASCQLPEVVNSDLKDKDVDPLVENLGKADFITDFAQGQWRMKLEAQRLAYRRRVRCRIPATTDRRQWMCTDRIKLKGGELGTVSGYIENITDTQDGQLILNVAVGPDLIFDPAEEADFADLPPAAKLVPLAEAEEAPPPAITIENITPITADVRAALVGYERIDLEWLTPGTREESTPFTATPVPMVTGGSGSRAVISQAVVDSQGRITQISWQDGGSDYVTGDVLTLTQGDTS
ncbi:MAG: hypothetical protein F4Z57_22535, partial [Gemmatimonadetes bacterium]|nr:hypothetical protein [Gemmatimonadota bacterium]MYI61110.1 hypothetical protein [Gemmatimonadota bacterium]